MKPCCLKVFGLLLFTFVSLFSFEPLRVFIRGGVDTHGPGEHEHTRFLNDWKVLLSSRGMKVDG
ncbi:MAG TPA: hypothetical protein EYQ50_12055 [Verrucomicrobiales bacterium]|jgi:hypothetical protein|nr:hypothetical protein [Verrucomicrobiales bacterium]HIL71763.1 hypothetical protein [Verrucomicrobiota bacterium]